MKQAAAFVEFPSGADIGGREIGLAAIAAFLTAAIWLAGWMDPLDRIAGDATLRWTHRNTADAPVAVVAIDDESIATVGPLPWPRGVLARLITAARNEGATGIAIDLLIIEPVNAIDDTELESALDSGPSILAAALDRDGRWLLPHHRFGGLHRAAHVHAEVGVDGVVRTFASTKQSDGLSLPALSLSAARLADPEIPIEPGVFLRPDFRPGPSRVLQVSAADLLAGGVSAGSLAGRMVFVGVTATGSGDQFVVPTGPGTAPSPGVLVHASAAASILRGGLIHRQGPWWALLFVFVSAVAPQLIRTRAGSLRPWSLVAMAVAIVVATIAAMELGNLQLPAMAYIVAMLLSAALREGLESQLAQRESGLLLQSLFRHHRPDAEVGVPRSAVDRLAVLRLLQAVVLEEDTSRRTLLDGMRDGVLMWDANGRTRVINPAAVDLWGHEAEREDIDSLTHDGEGSTVLDRHGREVEVSVFTVGDGGMALLRDVTAERELERKRRDMQRLVSHELKTPLSSIAGFGETLERYELSPEEQRRVAALIRGESLRLGEMVATFLDLERLGADQTAQPLEPVELDELVRRRLEILAEAARSRGQTLTSSLDSGVVVQGSAELLARVVDNLVGNALKYSNEESEVIVAVRIDHGTAILSVADRGPGIPEDARERIFERFYRIPGVEGSGSGLGLAMVDEVVSWHGGCIVLDSTVGRGSTFTVRFPAEE